MSSHDFTLILRLVRLPLDQMAQVHRAYDQARAQTQVGGWKNLSDQARDHWRQAYQQYVTAGFGHQAATCEAWCEVVTAAGLAAGEEMISRLEKPR